MTLTIPIGPLAAAALEHGEDVQMSTTEIAAKTQMLIRRSAHEVFDAFVDPAVTTKFWFTRSDGRVAVELELFGLLHPEVRG